MTNTEGPISEHLADLIAEVARAYKWSFDAQMISRQAGLIIFYGWTTSRAGRRIISRLIQIQMVESYVLGPREYLRMEIGAAYQALVT